MTTPEFTFASQSPRVDPLAQATEVARILALRIKGRDAQLRRSFIRRRSTKRPTPLMHMLRGGRGGEVRLKLYLSLLWVAVAKPHSATYPARTWATLLGLPDPSTSGARRINDAFDWLEQNQFIKTESRRGVPRQVTLRDDAGSGREYSLPGARITELRASDHAFDRHIYNKLPAHLWTNGWITLMTGPALACFLVLLASQQRPEEPVWFSPSLLEERYDMSDDTRQRGMKTLAALGLVHVSPQTLNRTSADFQRVRNTYRLDLARLAARPQV